MNKDYVGDAVLRHFRTFYGRPKADVTNLKDLIEQARPKAQHRVERDRAFVAKFLSVLTPDQRATIERYIEAREEAFGLVGSALMLDWVLGEGLNPQMLRRNLDVPWGEELVEKFDRERA